MLCVPSTDAFVCQKCIESGRLYSLDCVVSFRNRIYDAVKLVHEWIIEFFNSVFFRSQIVGMIVAGQ